MHTKMTPTARAELANAIRRRYRSATGKEKHKILDEFIATTGYHEKSAIRVLIPLTYSIANGLGFGIIAWAILHVATGKFRRQDWLLYLLAALFLARFIYLGAS